jgi:hypothetical protein
LQILDAALEGYETYLKDKYRPPSKGGNTRAWHQHVVTIGGEKYSFLALGARKWAFAKDTISFDWLWDETERYRNIDSGTIVTKDASGKVVLRGERGTKPWRTAETRMPVSRREQRD